MSAQEEADTLPATETAAGPPVLAVLVVHDGLPWLPRTLSALAAQSHPHLDIVAVDNASADGSRELLLDQLAEDQVLVADRDLGFGGAVSMALDARPTSEHRYVLLVHDDLELAPDAVAELVSSMEADPRLAAVGPKLRAWGASTELQALGSTIDITGRMDTGVDPGELDQGQRDQEDRALFVSTAGMLVRRSVFDELGGLDRRFHVFRDDLDLCWRAWLAGHDVEVVPTATAEHAGAAANYLRLGQTRFIGPRYFAERNTLAALLKNYGTARLFLVVPLFFLVGLAKVVGFLLTRRFSDAWQTVRAWVWNVTHLAETRRYRRAVQSRRVRADEELAELFGRLGPRVRAYGEAMASWVAGGDADPAPELSHDAPMPDEPRTATARLVAFARQRPVLLSGGLLGVVAVAGMWPLLRPGELRGGGLAPWPDRAMVFLGDHAAAWHDAAAFGTSSPPAPSQALLGLLHLMLGNSGYLASRAVLMLPFVVAWLLALRAAQIYSDRRLPRVVAATAYVLSPPAFAALATGRIEALVVFAVLPGLVAGLITAARLATPPARAWRAVAGYSLLGAIAGAFEPAMLLVLPVVGAGAALVVITRADALSDRAILAGRLGVASAAPLLLNLPWSWGLLAEDGPLLGAPVVTEQAGDPLWTWLLLSPGLAGFPGVVAGAGFLLAGLLGLALGWRRNEGLVTASWAAALLGATAAWWVDRVDSAVWAGTPLLVTVAAFAAAFALAFATGARRLARHAFGWRQVAALVTVLGVTVSIVGVAWALVREPFGAYVRGEPTLPSFVQAEAVTEGPFRVLVLAAADGAVTYEVVDGRGVTMAAYGLRQPPATQRAVDNAVQDLLAARDPGAADVLGRWGIRYLIVPDGAEDAALTDVLLAQDSLEPRPVASGQLHAVTGWLPQAAVLSPTAAGAIADRGALPSDEEVAALEVLGNGRATGTLAEERTVLLAEAEDAGWELWVEGQRLQPEPGSPVVFTEVPAGEVELRHTGETVRGLTLTAQVLLLLLVISLALRPPGAGRHARPSASSAPDEGTP